MPVSRQPENAMYGTADTLQDAWCVYSISRNDNENGGAGPSIYLGFCKLADVYNTPDARRNSQFTKLIRPKEFIWIKLVATGTKAECYNFHGEQLRQTRPEMNRLGYMVVSSRPFICDQNGREYQTQSAAARELAISQSALSKHLGGSTSHRSVNGYTFHYKF